MLPPIVGMRKLETLYLDGCNQLCKYPSEIEVAPSSIETYYSEGISSPLKRKSSSSQRGVLSFYNLMVMEFPRFLKELELGLCNLGDEDIPAGICELSQLQILDLRGNGFSRLHFNLSQLSRLKLLNVSHCSSLVELPQLPPGMVILQAYSCDSFETLEDFPSNCKCLRTVAITMENKQCLIGSERVLQSMLQGNSIENHSFVLLLPAIEIPKGFVKWNTFTLQLPHDWCNDFTGFLIFTTFKSKDSRIPIIKMTMKHEMSVVMDKDSQVDDCKESNNICEYGYSITQVGYASFGDLRHSAWWNSAYNTISFSFDTYDVLVSEFVVELVPRKSKGDPRETTKATIVCSQFSDEDHNIYSQFLEENYRGDYRLKIEHDSKSSLEISWRL